MRCRGLSTSAYSGTWLIERNLKGGSPARSILSQGSGDGILPPSAFAATLRSRKRHTSGARGTMKSSRMTTYILVAMILGIATGGLIHSQFADPATHKLFSGYIGIGSTIFLRLIKMIIGPRVFSTLVVGI